MKKSLMITFILLFSIFSYSHTEHHLAHDKFNIAIDSSTFESSDPHSGHPVDDSLKFIPATSFFAPTIVIFILIITSLLFLFIRFKRIMAILTPIQFQSNYVVHSPFIH
ncbi:hypothetical protein PZE06_18650 [Robertmurraya sp. DFI.2.37]|uniref:hypothetical protein n=1 Tax=Robertmurraya sp. DFI.2.37 TaxID=3031819 RepID=UPI0023DC3401|nr:hypothetical protein [Robertmurraya sp. DFI.2.37]MDF1510157.1 hypothetical protein [Robertmurraya sp. DFI.2.37]